MNIGNVDRKTENSVINYREIIREKDREIEELRRQIKSATHQYNELMKVAQYYHDECIGWRNKWGLN